MTEMVPQGVSNNTGYFKLDKELKPDRTLDSFSLGFLGFILALSFLGGLLPLAITKNLH